MCDCTCSNMMCMLKYLLIKPKTIFECFICFWKWFYTFVILVFVQNAFLCFYSKTGSKVFSQEALARSSQLRASCKMCLREISKVTFSYRKSHYCLMSISRLNPSREMVFRLKLEISKFHIEAIAIVSWLRASCESFSMSRDCFATL